MKILLTGATGFVGKNLVKALEKSGHELIILSRDSKQAKQVLGGSYLYESFDLSKAAAPSRLFSGVDGVVNLAGESIAGGRWTEARKQAIHDSRTVLTRNLVLGMREAKTPVVFVSTSAVGIYGDRAEELLSESSSPGSGFLTQVCLDWEAEAQRAQDFDARVVLTRFGMVLGQGGGALASMLPAFRLNLGASLGSGKQWMSWIHLHDLIRAIELSLLSPEIKGALNLVSPEAVRNEEFTQVLARVLERKALMRVPAPVLKLTLGEMAHLLLDSARVSPARLQNLGFEFSLPHLRDALREACGTAA